MGEKRHDPWIEQFGRSAAKNSVDAANETRADNITLFIPA